MIHRISNQLKRWFRKSCLILRMRQVKDRDFCIIASNCTGALPYRFLRLPYNTPTINLFFYAPDFLRFVQNLDYYLAQPLRFAPESRFEKTRSIFAAHGSYPIGRLDDIEIHFMHYVSESEAEEKWNRRKARINRDKLVIAFTDKDLCTPQLLRDFDALPYQHKYVLTAKSYPEIKSSIVVPAFAGQTEVGDTYTNYDTLAHIDFADLIKTTPAEQTESVRELPV